ncbi:MAG TPA: bifunctional precorrin-2 dehydrogenase/sirohydrochlorin ferrochelatase [Phycisphaerae bacterium]|jgi:precorrin-2 dehydrogenase/sirohydrochlorin ferrochelatase|nr:bifunctional precorrin-2 dehydrogenase/sirohydrochlorin ferrochelatase [Phycisphaerae bacterium]HOB75588.1 bifunctional precorrin-2 dehydrogenase/sirohydrochlorin ferrochelatase [Phycisphaerae bacterium]HOJ55142.1 bifunctional precorrin-2 dehydrogenase/sirohydrochlorin ferrochelatase [Phycisphaerae bacterium]HOL27344.1 bifunctional precorrin-2 dehydrogenase/sirohydrochlorin ferrochelatase [Phycisphaerae bacterium]HPP20716.1 bifunctional precorrin-2 dehydrogenase/sirohydrochlorin ferrochelata
MPTYPVELKLTGRTVLVVGGGEVAVRKVAGLLQAGATVRIVSPNFCQPLLNLREVTREARAYSPECLDGVCLVFACTDDRQVNAAVAADARARGIWCNVADEPSECDFFVPAVHRQGELSISVGTGGASPRLAALLRDRLASHSGPEWGILIEELARARGLIKTRVADPGLRRQILDTLCTECSIRLLATRGREPWRRWFERVTEYRLQGRTELPETS